MYSLELWRETPHSSLYRFFVCFELLSMELMWLFSRRSVTESNCKVWLLNELLKLKSEPYWSSHILLYYFCSRERINFCVQNYSGKLESIWGWKALVLCRKIIFLCLIPNSCWYINPIQIWAVTRFLVCLHKSLWIYRSNLGLIMRLNWFISCPTVAYVLYLHTKRETCDAFDIIKEVS